MASPGASRNSRAKAERQQVAALGGDQRMQLVEHDALEAAEQIRRVGAGEQQRELLGRGEQDVRRIAALALALARPACRRCGSRSGPAGPSRAPASPGCARCRPPAPSAARCRACAGHPDRRTSRPVETSRRGFRACARSTPPASAGSRPASCRRRSARSAAPSGRRGRAPAVRAGARAASSRAAQTSARMPPAAAWRFRPCARGSSQSLLFPASAFFTNASL